MKHLQYLLNGLIKQNPTLVLLLGTCPTLAVTTSAINGVGMGFSTLFVLVCSNIVISLIKNIVPKSVRIPCYIVVISAFVTILGLVVQAYLPDINNALGIYLPLIVVNCIVLGRAEMFASKHGVLDSMLDGVGMGLGFTLALICMGSVREFFAQGSRSGWPSCRKAQTPWRFRDPCRRLFRVRLPHRPGHRHYQGKSAGEKILRLRGMSLRGPVPRLL